VITVAVRWYLRYGLSYRDVEELLAEPGIAVDHVTINRWVQRFTVEFIEAARPRRHVPGTGGSPTRLMSRSPADGGLLEVGGAVAGGVQLTQQGQGLAARRLLDQRQLAHLLSVEGLAQPGGLGVEAAAAAGFAQQGAQLGDGEPGGGRGRRGREDGAGLRAHDAAAGVSEGGAEGRSSPLDW